MWSGSLEELEELLELKTDVYTEAALPPTTEATGKHKRSFECTHCPKTVMSKLSLRNHLLKVHGIQNETYALVCPTCGRAGFSKLGLTLHNTRMHIKKPKRRRTLNANELPSTDDFKIFEKWKLEPTYLNPKYDFVQAEIPPISPYSDDSSTFSADSAVSSTSSNSYINDLVNSPTDQASNAIFSTVSPISESSRSPDIGTVDNFNEAMDDIDDILKILQDELQKDVPDTVLGFSGG